MPCPLCDMPDEDLMQAYARGDLAAFDTLYARHEAALFRFVRDEIVRWSKVVKYSGAKPE